MVVVVVVFVFVFVVVVVFVFVVVFVVDSYTGPVAGSTFVDRCVGCSFFVAGKQLRIHNTTQCRFHVRLSRGICTSHVPGRKQHSQLFHN